MPSVQVKLTSAKNLQQFKKEIQSRIQALTMAGDIGTEEVVITPVAAEPEGLTL